MDFLLSEERQILSDTVDKFFSKNYSIEKRFNGINSDDGFDKPIWAESCNLGIVSALVPTEFGGFGGTGEDIAVIFEIIGKHLVVEPFLSTAILGSVPLWKKNYKNCGNLIPEICNGNMHSTLAFLEANSRYSPSVVETQANLRSTKYFLSGHKAVVMNAIMSDYMIVSARLEGEIDSEDGIGLFIVQKNAKGLKYRNYGTIDSGLSSDLCFDDVEAELIDDNAYDLLETTCSFGNLALAAEAVGIMGKIKKTTLEYLKIRKQFGKPLSSFQVLQHRMVELVTEIEQAKSSMMLASAYLDKDRFVREKYISGAKNLVGRVGKLVAEEAIQMHGGIAMCWEYDIAHYAKRLVMIDHVLGDADHHLERFNFFSNLN